VQNLRGGGSGGRGAGHDAVANTKGQAPELTGARYVSAAGARVGRRCRGGREAGEEVESGAGDEGGGDAGEVEDAEDAAAVGRSAGSQRGLEGERAALKLERRPGLA
jgi:hypothetical protein